MREPDELAEFGAGMRAALASLCGSGQVRRAMFAPHDGAGEDGRTWSVLAGQLDLPGLMLPEEHGGSGLGVVEAAVAFEEAGRALLGGPLFATAGLAVPLLLELGDDAVARHGPAVARGELTATVALTEDDGAWSTPGVRSSAVPDAAATSGGPGGWRLSGTKDLVVDGASAGLVLVVARMPDGAPAVFSVEGAAAGLTRTPLVTLDLTRRMAWLSADSVPARLLACGDRAAGAVEAAAAVSRTLLAAEQVGGAQRCLDMSVGFVSERFQFGRRIGSFQVIKQRLADALVRVESARSACHAAARSGAAELQRNSRVAALLATEAFIDVSADTIQLHGGLGFTWDHDAHLYYKRARTGALLLGTPGDHIAALAAILSVGTDEPELREGRMQ